MWEIIKAEQRANWQLRNRIEKLKVENRGLTNWIAGAREVDRAAGLVRTKMTDQIMRETGVDVPPAQTAADSMKCAVCGKLLSLGTVTNTPHGFAHPKCVEKGVHHERHERHETENR